MKDILCIQISTNLINKDINKNDIMNKYHNKLYKVKYKDGYYKGSDFWEVPKWIGLINYNVPCDLYVCKDIDKTVNYLLSNDYDFVCFSVLDVNKDIIKKIINSDKLKSKTFIIGGYINFDKYLHQLKHGNCIYFDKIKDFINWFYNKHDTFLKVRNFKYGFNYSIFKGFKCIPRLTLSEGCLNNCDFCTIEHKLKRITISDILKEIESFKDLDFKLIYINDKTFGQCHNYRILSSLYKRIKAFNKKFKGFIIQTTSTTFLYKFTHDFLSLSHIKFVEIGLESFNDNILGKYHKPSNCDSIKRVFDYVRFHNKISINSVYIIPNIIIGFPEENITTYNNTLNILNKYQDVISHFNIYNLAIYNNTKIANKIKHTKTDSNELNVNKSFHTSNIHKLFYNTIFKLGLNFLGDYRYRKLKTLKHYGV
jgi:uncharacterized radical SAM superfamily protein